MTLRVVIADDDDRVRRDFRSLLELETDIEVVGLAPDGAVALDLAARLRPDVVVMDVRMPVLDGIAATKRLREGNPPHSRVLVITTFDMDEYVLGAARAGASGFLLKDNAPEELARGVRTVAFGDALVSPRATARLLQEFVVVAPRHSDAVATLTEREIDIVRLMARGMNNDQIAEAAFISLGTTKTHVSNVLAKLNLQSRIQIVVWAYENGVTG